MDWMSLVSGNVIDCNYYTQSVLLQNVVLGFRNLQIGVRVAVRSQSSESEVRSVADADADANLEV